MNEQEINSLFKTASSFAEQTYKELFNRYPDTSQGATSELLDALMQAWLTGYSYLRIDPQLDKMIKEIFGFYVDSEY